MKNRICNGCFHFCDFLDPDKVKRYRCSETGTYVRPSGTCNLWKDKEDKDLNEPKAEDPKEKKTVRVWNPRSKRHEDVEA